ncbi:hypothetical protein V1264_005712 [Littorina saxatilis]|uniref:Uncharacterized protein n=1 Tax=Littorina saxatilis TaxID=31220 RepID=A0AAN9B256_9CAEN
MWGHMKTLGLQINGKENLKGATALKVAEKRERLRSLIEGNPGILAGPLPLALAQCDDAPPSPTNPEDDAQSSSDEDVQDTETFANVQEAGLASFKFDKTGEVVVVAFAGGVWYPGVVDAVVSAESAVINYMHPSALTRVTVPLPDSAEFRFPAKKDRMETDSASVFFAWVDI